MVRTAKVKVTMRDLDRLKCVQGVIDGHLRLYEAASRLSLPIPRFADRHADSGPTVATERLRNRNRTDPAIETARWPTVADAL